MYYSACKEPSSNTQWTGAQHLGYISKQHRFWKGYNKGKNLLTTPGKKNKHMNRKIQDTAYPAKRLHKTHHFLACAIHTIYRDTI